MRHLTFTVFAVWATGCVYLQGALSNGEQEAQFLKHVDELTERDTLYDFNEAERLLLERSKTNPENSLLLWRLARGYYYKTLNKDCPEHEKRALFEKGIEYAKKALKLNERDPDAHKWFAILTGDRGKSLGMSDKVQAGMLFKKHIDRAIQLRSEDPSLHHLIGSFRYEVGKLSWLERKMVGVILNDLQKSTVDGAIESFLLADKYSKKPWKMNCVSLAKCYLHEQKCSDAKIWLDKAEAIQVKTREDKKAAEEIVALLKKLA